MEINDAINKYKTLSKTINSLLNIILYFIRVFYKVLPGQGENIVIISLHKLGDSIFTIPAIREIQKNYKKKIIIL
ncbi:MAG: hypothetical protein MUO60_18600, partial [Clostridiaceae bacterium]|nr:hypothetical protein [Clostridiaceae bacterium]